MCLPAGLVVHKKALSRSLARSSERALGVAEGLLEFLYAAVFSEGLPGVVARGADFEAVLQLMQVVLQLLYRLTLLGKGPKEAFQCVAVDFAPIQSVAGFEVIASAKLSSIPRGSLRESSTWAQVRHDRPTQLKGQKPKPHYLRTPTPFKTQAVNRRSADPSKSGIWKVKDFATEWG